MNKVLLAGRLTRDPEMRALASGKHVTHVACPVSQRGTHVAGEGGGRRPGRHLRGYDQRLGRDLSPRPTKVGFRPEGALTTQRLGDRRVPMA